MKHMLCKVGYCFDHIRPKNVCFVGNDLNVFFVWLPIASNHMRLQRLEFTQPDTLQNSKGAEMYGYGTALTDLLYTCNMNRENKLEPLHKAGDQVMRLDNGMKSYHRQIRSSRIDELKYGMFCDVGTHWRHWRRITSCIKALDENVRPTTVPRTLQRHSILRRWENFSINRFLRHTSYSDVCVGYSEELLAVPYKDTICPMLEICVE